MWRWNQLPSRLLLRRPGNKPTEMDTHIADAPTEMCPLQMKAIPIRVGAKTPANIHKAGVPMELYTPAAFRIPLLGAAVWP